MSYRKRQSIKVLLNTRFGTPSSPWSWCKSFGNCLSGIHTITSLSLAGICIPPQKIFSKMKGAGSLDNWGLPKEMPTNWGVKNSKIDWSHLSGLFLISNALILTHWERVIKNILILNAKVGRCQGKAKLGITITVQSRARGQERRWLGGLHRLFPHSFD